MNKKITILLIVFVLAAITPPAHGYEFMEEWDAGDTALQIMFVAVTATDWLQTRTMAKNGWMLDGKQHHERNILLGKYPDETKVNLMIGAGILGHTLVSMLLPKTINVGSASIPARTIWQMFFISVECWAVEHNYSAGIRIEF